MFSACWTEQINLILSKEEYKTGTEVHKKFCSKLFEVYSVRDHIQHGKKLYLTARMRVKAMTSWKCTLTGGVSRSLGATAAS